MNAVTATNQQVEQQSLPASGQIVPRVRLGRLDSVAAWRREIARVYKQMRRREIPSEDGTRLTYVARIGAQLTQIEEELRATQALIEARERGSTPVRKQFSAEDLYGSVPVERQVAEAQP
jgi:hypothetical protein